MNSRRLRLLARVAGVVLVALVLRSAGWNDRVVRADGAVLSGRIVERDDRAISLRTAPDRVLRLPRDEVGEVHEGLAGAFEHLALRPGFALLAVAAHLAAILVSYLRWHLLLAGAGLATAWSAVLRLAWAGQFVSVALPGGIGSGDLAKALYIAAHAHEGRRTRAVVTVFADRGIGLLMLCLLAAVAVLAVPATTGIGALRGLVLGLLAAGAAFAALAYSPTLQRWLHLGRLARRLPLRRIVDEVGAAVAVYRSRPACVLGAAGLSLLAHGLILGAFFCYGLALDAKLGLLAVGAAIPVAQMVSGIPALPGGWGVGDAAFLAFLPAAGVAAGKAVALSLTYRVVHTLLSLPGALWLAGVRGRPDAAPAR